MNWRLLGNSLLVSASVSLLAVTFGFFGGLFLLGLPARWRIRIVAVAIIALALPPFVVTNCWLHLLGAAGIWRRWLPFNILSLGGTIWLLSLMLWPFALLLISSAWVRLQPSQLESDPAVTGWHLIRYLLFPSARTALVQAALLIFVLALNNFSVPAILQVKVLPAEIWVRFTTNFDTLGTLQLSWPLVIVPLVAVWWLLRRDISLPRLESAVSPKLFRQQLGMSWVWLCGLSTVGVCVLAVGLPLFELVSVKRTWRELPGALAAGRGALWNSFVFAAISAALIVVLGLLAILWADSHRPKTRLSKLLGENSGSAEQPKDPHLASPLFGIFSLLLWLPFLLPGVLLGVGLVKFLNRPWLSFFYQSQAIVLLAFIVRYLVLGWTVVSHARQSLDRDLLDSARLEGASAGQMFRDVLWPQIAPQLGAAWYMIFLLCLWDVESMILIYPPGSETLALRIFNLLHYGYNPQISALCLCLLALAVAPLVVWKLAMRMNRARLRQPTHPILCA